MDNYQITSYSGAEIEALLVKIDELNGATPEAAGLMSAADKAKLDGVNSGAEVNRINRIMLGETEIAPTEKVVTLPLDTAPVLNGTKLLLSGAVYQALTNYYTKAQVDALISGIKQFSAVVVATLPESGEQFTLYLVGPTGTGADKYEEYIWNNDAWLKIGDTSIDLSGYATKEELSQLGQHVYKNLYNLSDLVINTFAGVCCDNFATGHISKASSTLGWDSIIIPIEAKNYLYTIENAPLIDGTHASKVVLYSGYPSASDATSKYVGVRNMALPSEQGQPATLVIESTYASAKYLLIPVVYGSSIDNIRIYVSNPQEEKDKIKDWVLGESYTVSNVERNSDGDVLSFDLTYPDGKTGSASITRNSDGDAISAVYTYNGVYTITITVARNSDGDLISSSIAII